MNSAAGTLFNFRSALGGLLYCSKDTSFSSELQATATDSKIRLLTKVLNVQESDADMHRHRLHRRCHEIQLPVKKNPYTIYSDQLYFSS
jgi:hypothetical protein